MNSLNPSERRLDRYGFTETLNGQFIARTGYGVYVYLNSFEIDQLFICYQNENTPLRIFIKQCVKNYTA